MISPWVPEKLRRRCGFFGIAELATDHCLVYIIVPQISMALCDSVPSRYQRLIMAWLNPRYMSRMYLVRG